MPRLPPLFCFKTGLLAQSQVLWLGYPCNLSMLLSSPRVMDSFTEKGLGVAMRSKAQGVCHHQVQGKGQRRLMPPQKQQATVT